MVIFGRSKQGACEAVGMKKTLLMLLLCLVPAFAENTELKKLAEADQAARQNGIPAPDAAAQDRVRRDAVLAMLAKNQIQTDTDYFNAALIMQHGDRPEDYMLAHELAMVAAVKGNEQGIWLAAASWDRYLQNVGKPQRFGTQYRKLGGSGWTVDPVDPMLTDAVRKDMNVPSLEDSRKRAAQLNSGQPAPSRD